MSIHLVQELQSAYHVPMEITVEAQTLPTPVQTGIIASLTGSNHVLREPSWQVIQELPIQAQDGAKAVLQVVHVKLQTL